MQTTGYGDLAASIGRQQQLAGIKRVIETRSQEAATGVLADPAAALRGQYGPLASIEGTLERLRGWQANIDVVDRQLGAMQLALETIESYVEPTRQGLMSAAQTDNAGQIGFAVNDAREKLDGVLSVLNARVGARGLFSGTASDRLPFEGGADALLEALRGATSGAANASELIARIDAWFEDPDGFAGSFYTGGDTAIGPIPVGDGQSVSISIIGTDPALRDTLKAFATAAMADSFAGQSDEMAAIAAHAGQALLTTATDRGLVAGTLGLAEGKLETARSHNAAERTALELSRTAMLSADPFEAASALTEAQVQLETLFATTARMMRLSLLNYL